MWAAIASVLWRSSSAQLERIWLLVHVPLFSDEAVVGLQWPAR